VTRLALAAVALALAGCGGGEDERAATTERVPRPPGPPPERPRPTGPKPLARATCPVGLPGCRSVRGVALFVQRVDPDGDGDLHVVVTGGSVSAPGVTSIDVAKGLRPARDPGIGDVVTAAGQVQPGSARQPQIHASVFRVQPK
jgi:hypothetical protein